MILRLFMAIGLSVCCIHLPAQLFSWVAPVIGGGVGKAVAVDAEGNVYSCGNANGQVDFDPGPDEALSPANSGSNGDIYVVKYDNDGNYLWHYLAGGSNTDIAKNVVVDGNGDVLMCGYFSGSFDWDPGPDVVQPPLNTNYDSFVLKISSEGEFLWVQRMVGDGEEQAYGLAVDADNNAYLCGYYSDDVTFGDGAATLPFQGGTLDGYYAKYSASGSLLWAKTIAGTGFQRANSVACSGDRLYLYGACTGTTTANGTHTLTLPNTPGVAYLCKTDTAGNVLWLKSHSATDNMGGDVVRTNGTDLYVFSSFRGTVDADPGADILELLPTEPTDQHTLFAKLDTSGNALWAHYLQGNVHFDLVGDLALDAEGAVVVTCAVGEMQDYDTGPGEAIYTPVQPNDLYTARYAADGGFRWVRMITTGETFDTASGAAVDLDGNVYMTGTFGDSAVFDPGPGGTFYTDNSTTAFTVKYGVDPNTGLPEEITSLALQIMPNPTRELLTIMGAFERGDALVVLDAAGREVMSLMAQDHLMQLSVQQLGPGVYSLVWSSNMGRVSERFVVM